MGANQNPIYMESALRFMQQQGALMATARRIDHTAQQTVIAQIMDLAERGAVLTVPQTPDKKGKPRPALVATFSREALAAIDGDNRTKTANGGNLYALCWAWVAKALNVDDQVAKDIVAFAARLVSMGYTLAEWNGTISEDESGACVVNVAEYNPATPQHQQPGMWRVKPVHVATDQAGAFYRDARLCRLIDVVVNGETQQRADDTDMVQELCIDDTKQYFFVGPVMSNGKRRQIDRRIGRSTFMAVTAALKQDDKTAAETAAANAAKARDAANAAAHETGPSTATAGPGNPARGEGEGEPAQTPPAGTQTPPAGTAPAANAPQAPAPASNGTPQQQAPAAPQQQHRGDDGENKGREDKEKMEQAVTLPKVREFIRTAMKPGRVKDDPEYRAAAMEMYSTLYGVLKVSGHVTAEWLADPVKAATGKGSSDNKPSVSAARSRK